VNNILPYISEITEIIKKKGFGEQSLVYYYDMDANVKTSEITAHKLVVRDSPEDYHLEWSGSHRFHQIGLVIKRRKKFFLAKIIVKG
jgi:hypothetical protein